MRKVRLTESDLHRIVRESVKKTIMDEGFKNFIGNSIKKAKKIGKKISDYADMEWEDEPVKKKSGESIWGVNTNGKVDESHIDHVIKESMRKVIVEHEADWFDDGDIAYIGRTSAYYDDDDDSIYTPEYWTYSDTPDDKDFAGEVYELDEEGKSELNWWIRCQRFNGYQRQHAFNPNMSSPEQMWNELDSNYGTLVRE